MTAVTALKVISLLEGPCAGNNYEYAADKYDSATARSPHAALIVYQWAIA